MNALIGVDSSCLQVAAIPDCIIPSRLDGLLKLGGQSTARPVTIRITLKLSLHYWAEVCYTILVYGLVEDLSLPGFVVISDYTQRTLERLLC